MSATYDSSLPTDRDWVRFKISDTAVSPASSALFSDEELDALLTEEDASGSAKKYYAAATASEILLTRWLGKGRGFVEKQVDELRLRFGTGEGVATALEKQIASLRAEGARRLSPAPFYFKAHG